MAWNARSGCKRHILIDFSLVGFGFILGIVYSSIRLALVTKKYQDVDRYVAQLLKYAKEDMRRQAKESLK